MLREDAKLTKKRDDNTFKNLVFAHAFATQNRDLFYGLFPEHKPEHDPRNPEEWAIPESIEELEKMMAEFNVQSTR